jgi:hypothetical protein
VLAVHGDDRLRPGAQVEVVDILGDHGDAAARDMGGPFAFEAGEPWWAALGWRS